MKNCRDYADQISAFLDGELSRPERGELMEHMAACRNCRQYFEDLTAIRDAAAEIGEVPVPEGFARRVMDRVRAVEQDRAPKTIRFPWRRWTALAACCAFVLFGAWCLQNFRTMRGADLAAGQEMAAANDMARTAGAAGMPGTMDGGENGTMTAMDGEQPVGSTLSRMADSASETAEAEEEDAVEVNAGLPEASAQAAEDGYVRESAKDAPAPSPAAPAGDAAGGTLVAGGDIVRQWVEDELGLEWESGRVYELTGEQYAGLIDLLEDAGVEFRAEAGDACRLIGE